MGNKSKPTLVERARAAIKSNYLDKGYKPKLNGDGSFSWVKDNGEVYSGNGPGTNQYNYNSPIHRRLNQEVARITQEMLESQKQQQLIEKYNPLPKNTSIEPTNIVPTSAGNSNDTPNTPLMSKSDFEPKDDKQDDIEAYDKRSIEALAKIKAIASMKETSDATTNPYPGFKPGSAAWYEQLYKSQLADKNLLESNTGSPYDMYEFPTLFVKYKGYKSKITRDDYELIRLLSTKFDVDKGLGPFIAPHVRNRLDTAIGMYIKNGSIPEVIKYFTTPDIVKHNDKSVAANLHVGATGAHISYTRKDGGKLIPKAQQGTKFKYDPNTIGDRMVNKASQFIEPALDLTMFINQKRLINKIKEARQSTPILQRTYTKTAIRPVQGLPQSTINSELNAINDTHNTVASSDPNIFTRSAEINSANREKMIDNMNTTNAKVILEDRQRHDKEVAADEARYGAIRDANAIGKYNKEVSDINATAMADQEKRRVNSMFITQILHNLAGREQYVAQNEMFKLRSQANTAIANRAHLEEMLSKGLVPLEKKQGVLNQIEEYNKLLTSLSKNGMPTQNEIAGAALTGKLIPKF